MPVKRPAMAGPAMIDQCDPSQRSTRTTPLLGLPPTPTAMQPVLDEQDTLVSASPDESEGIGLATIAQPVPSHRSVKAWLSDPPTAKQLVGDEHEISESASYEVAPESGLGTIDQPVPSQCSSNAL